MNMELLYHLASSKLDQKFPGDSRGAPRIGSFIEGDHERQGEQVRSFSSLYTYAINF